MTNKPERRKIHFDSIDEAVADAERLAAGDVKTTGHYSFGQILDHLGRAMDTVTGELAPPPVKLPLRLAMRVVRPIMIKLPLPTGFKLPPKTQSLLWSSEDIDVPTGLNNWKKSIERYKQTEPLQPHPVFGKMNRQQHDQVQCRHSELHLSFVHSVE